MKLTEAEIQFNEILEDIADSLDISPSKYKEAMERFHSLKQHLEEGYYPSTKVQPEVYMQGSFRLGTVVRPYKEGKDTDYDIDVVCRLKQEKNSTEPKNLKNNVGEEVNAYARKNSMRKPKEKRRCWVLEYAPDSNDIGFHMDVLPCVHDQELAEYIASEDPALEQYANTTIALTNRDDDIRPPQYDWRSGNPHGYAKWFWDVNYPGFVIFEKEQKRLIFKDNRDIYSSADDVHNELVHTPLQRVIQILKRHRDIYFTGHKWEKHKPISIIITTLASRLYEGKASSLRTVYDTLIYIVEQLIAYAGLLEPMPYLSKEISALKLIQRIGNRWYIPNPVNPHFPGDPEDKGENFADRWHEQNHVCARAFFDWIKSFRNTFEAIVESSSYTDISKHLESSLKVSKRSSQSQLSNISTKQPVIPSYSSVTSRFNVPHRQAPRWPLSLGYNSVYIRAFASRNDSNWLVFNSDTSPLPKNYSLKFEARTNVPHPFDVYWQVVNTGDEALRAKDLRGGFYSSSMDDLIHKETTRYKGQHWIECFIVKNGICMARSGEFIVNIQ